MNALYLIARIAEERIALRADIVESVVEIESITPVPRAAAHVAGLSALRSRVLTIIDPLASLGLGRSPDLPVHKAVVVSVEGHLYGLLVEDVEDVVPLVAKPSVSLGTLEDGWSRVAAGVVEHEETVLLEVDAAALIAGAPALAA